MVDQTCDPQGILLDEVGLMADQLLDRAASEVERWTQDGLLLLTLLDRDYPNNLRGVHDRPPLIFVSGRLDAHDDRSIALIGTRQPSGAGLNRARQLTSELCEAGFTVVSGLAKGIDTAVHRAALEQGRTLAVVGTGLHRCYPPENRALQDEIASAGAVISPFWPDAPPTRASFPRRNGVMSGLTRATVIIEAGARSGARIQARMALSHGRPVVLFKHLLSQDWARQLSERPGTHIVAEPGKVAPLIEGLYATEELVA